MFGDASTLTLSLPLSPPAGRRSVLGAALTGAAALSLAACGGSGGAGSSAAGGVKTAKTVEQASLRLTWIKNAEFAGFFVAQDKGYYKDEGIDLTINASAQNLPEVQAITTRADLLGLSGSTTLMLARAQGIPVKAFGALFQKGPGCFLWLERSGIKGIKDFKGKKVGGLPTAKVSTDAILGINGMKPEDVTFVPVGFDVTPLLTGQVDVLAGLVTNQVILLEQRGEKVGYAPYNDLGFVSYWNTPFALEETLKNKKALLVAWLRASARGWDYALKNPDEVATLVVSKYGEGLDLTNQTLELKRETPLIKTSVTAQKGLFWMDRAVWQQAHDALYKQTKQLEKALNLDDVYTMDILNAVGKIGG